MIPCSLPRPVCSLRQSALAMLLVFAHVLAAQGEVAFERIVLSEQFYSEGADFADFNADGYNDVVSGPFWYAGPTFKSRYRYMPGERVSIKAYSKHFFSFASDINGDEHPDVLVIGMPGQAAHWFENPGSNVEAKATWTSHFVSHDVGNESPTLMDITGNGHRELVCVHGGAFGYLRPRPEHTTEPWQFQRITPNKGFGNFTHGLGVGDVNQDGRLDVLETNGWHEHTATENAAANLSSARFVEHAQRFAQAGGAQMFAYDFDGDGDNDVLSVQNAHAHGLTWFERRGTNDSMLWVPHEILTDRINARAGLPAISQMHGVALTDIDGDGIKDIVTGKRFFAHGGGDPGAFQLPVLYWFKTIRGSNGVRFEANLIDNRVGVGTQLTTGDIDGDGRADIVVGNKLGTHVLLNRGSKPGASDRTADQNLAAERPGTDDFARGVRESGPLTPEEEMATFVLPPGFKAQLVASEPQIEKPLNMAFDDRGRLWVTSTLEYPWPAKEGTTGRDSVKVLEDKDGDGSFESVNTFADGLNIPIGLYPYRDGVICYSIPNIWFLRDTDGDGKCDKREKLYGPFDYSRDAHGMCNGFLRGFDGWLYACHGFNNQSSVTGRDGNRVTMHSGNTFRFRLDGRRIEHFTNGQVNPFGMAYDARGDLLTADCHTKPVTLLLQGGYYDSFGKPHDGLGYVPDVMQHLHGSTAIGGIAICTSKHVFPEAYANNTFGGNVMTSRINRNSLRYEGSSVRAQEEPDLLISGDSWFRPVDLKFGPDGALYVADFYNRIIGHYEVPLDHPGRDRTSGRIWRISYEGSANVDTQQRSIALLNATELARELSSDNATRRMLALDRLASKTEATKAERIETARRTFRQSDSEHARIGSMWALFRLEAITDEEIDRAIADESASVRTHAMRLVGESRSAMQGDARRQTAIWIALGLKDTDAIVVRAAAMAATRCIDGQLVIPLLEAYRQCASGDVHLRHALRMALRNHLRDAANFEIAIHSIRHDETDLIAGICLALKTPPASKFVAHRIAALAKTKKENLADYVLLAMQGVTDSTAEEIVKVARTTFDSDPTFQLNLLNSLRAGISPAEAIPSAISSWATDLATRLLAVDNDSVPIPWEFVPDPASRDSRNPWMVSLRRKSADNGQATALWSSFPLGEQRTGTVRSGSFQMPDKLEFWIAGHDGYPEQTLQQRNLVRVRDAETGRILKSWNPPRNDVAQPRRWDAEDAAGQRVYVELVDGDPSGAFAWLAVGRFSIAGLNPMQIVEDRRNAARLAKTYQLHDLRPHLVDLLRRTSTDRQSKLELARTLADLLDSDSARALAEGLAIGSLSEELQTSLIDALTSDVSGKPQSETDSGATSRAALFADLMRFASTIQQKQVLVKLCRSRLGIEQLLALLEKGQANVQIFSDPVVRSQIDAVASAEQQLRMTEFIDQMQSESPDVQEQIDARVADLMAQRGNPTRGKLVFEKNCATCHQVGGSGKQVGPNLDGIGNRGIARLCEDLLAPNRNVDAGFRASTLVTDDGRAFTGLVKLEDNRSVTMIDTTGQQHVIRKTDIELRKTTALSPMPSNLGETLAPNTFRDLVAYLKSLNR